MRDFTPDYNNIVKAARNETPDRMPIYEHIISPNIMEKILNCSFADLLDGDRGDKKEFFRNYCEFFRRMGYDTVSFERCIGGIMPGSGALGDHKPGIIKNREDFEKYPWDDIPDIYFKTFDEDYELLREAMPEGMKAIGGPGNGVFECVQDVVGYMDLCYISADDPELYSDLFQAVGRMMYRIWEGFLEKYSDIYCVCRFGDDLGFKSMTLLPPDDIKRHILPQYRNLVGLIHRYNKPFLFHSCGQIFDIMEDLISEVKIDAKHSNEDQIAPFSVWVERYGDRIGNFGGVDTDHLCRKSEQEIREIVRDVIAISIGSGGFALGSGNSIPDYVPVEGYLTMVEEARKVRGDDI
jgi:uroporphyrinogen decarboxylase